MEQLAPRIFLNVFSAGLNIWVVEEKLGIRGKYLTEYNIKQRFKNNIWSLSLIYIPNILSEKK